MYRKLLFQSLILVFLIQIIPSTIQSAAAKKPHPHKHKTNQFHNSGHNDRAVSLNQAQRDNLIDILNGRERNFNLSPTIRVEINNGVNSLPPGIQKQLARGKTLPPGIVKKVVLPNSVNSHLNLSSDATIVVIGSSVVLVNPQNLILDVLHGIF